MQEAHEMESEKPQLSSEEIERIRKGVERSEKLADLLDKKMLDPIIGAFIPEGGDAVTALAGLYIIYEAKKADMSSWELSKMVGRTGLDWLSGSVPIIGDLFDFVYKSNATNAQALREHFEKIASEIDDIPKQEGELIAKDREGELEKLKGNIEEGEKAA